MTTLTDEEKAKASYRMEESWREMLHPAGRLFDDTRIRVLERDGLQLHIVVCRRDSDFWDDD